VQDKVTIPKPTDLDLLVRLIDMRDSAHLAGHINDPFRLFEFNGTESVLFSPGRNEGINITTMGMRRLQHLDFLQLIDILPKGFTFDLVDDVRDRLEETRVALGQPSRLGEAQAATQMAEAARAQAETVQRDLVATIADRAATRAARRSAFANRVGRSVGLIARVVLGIIYVGVVVLAGFFVTANLPMAIVVAVIAVAVLLTVVDWLFHIDGFALAVAVESRTVSRTTRWLESFDADD
jgi:hypothetical protein